MDLSERFYLRFRRYLWVQHDLNFTCSSLLIAKCFIGLADPEHRSANPIPVAIAMTVAISSTPSRLSWIGQTSQTELSAVIDHGGQNDQTDSFNGS